MHPIIQDEISQILLRNDISILSGIRDKVCYSVGNEVRTVKFNHYDHKVIVSAVLSRMLLNNIVEVEDKPYLILQPKDRNYFRILKVSTQNNELLLQTVPYPHHHTNDSEFEIIVIDDEEEGIASQKTSLSKISLPSDSNFIKYNEIAELIRLNEELYKKNKALEKINADLSIFVYTASHDLLVPLSRVEAMMNLLEHETLTPDAISFVQIIQISFLKFKETVKELAESGKAEADTLTSTINIHEILEEVIMSLQNDILSTHTSIIIHIQDHEIQLSKKNLRSLLYNLISNAIKFRSPERSSEINISTSIKDEFLTLTVSDKGIGIGEEQIENIFNLYQRLNQQVDGQGVGLYLVKKIMENSGGKIEMKSEYGKGTTFTLFFKQ